MRDRLLFVLASTLFTQNKRMQYLNQELHPFL